MPPPFDGHAPLCAHVVDVPAGYGDDARVALITGDVHKLHVDSPGGPGACQRVLEQTGIEFTLVKPESDTLFQTEFCGQLKVAAGQQALLARKPKTRRWPPPGQLARATKKLQEEVGPGDWCMTRNIAPDIPYNCKQARVWEVNQGAAIGGNQRLRARLFLCGYPCRCSLCAARERGGASM